jgi:exopolysaccharide biosynthesis polyprenyl glycosylphosphotransferase
MGVNDWSLPARPRARFARRNAAQHDPRRRARFIVRVFVCADVIALAFAFAATEYLFHRHSSAPRQLNTWEETVVAALALPTWIFLAKASGLYGRDSIQVEHSTAEEAVALTKLVSLGSWLVLVMAYLLGLHPYLPHLIAFWTLSLGSLLLARGVTRTVLHRMPAYAQRTVIVGAGEIGQLIAMKLAAQPSFGIELVGFVDRDPRSLNRELRNVPVLGDAEDIVEIISRNDVDRVIIAFSRELDQQTIVQIAALRDRHVQVDIVPRLFDSLGPRAALHSLSGFPLVSVSEPAFSPSALIGKRCFDVVGSVLLLLLLAPIFLLVAVMIKLDSPGPVFYRQERIGQRGRTFRILKFRTMRIDADAYLASLIEQDPRLRAEYEALHKLTNDPRVTPIGRLLRAASLDELPQIMNVLKGDMSLVGPRPIVEAERHRYRHEATALVDVRPGMTGYWQISGRSNVSYAERVRLDLAYVRNWSLGLDILILAKTARALFHRQGAY